MNTAKAYICPLTMIADLCRHLLNCYYQVLRCFTAIDYLITSFSRRTAPTDIMRNSTKQPLSAG